MVLEYFSSKKANAAPAKAAAGPKSPVLTPENEAFLKRLAAEEPPKDNQVAIVGETPSNAAIDGADKVPLPVSPPAVEESRVSPERKKSGDAAAAEGSKKKNRMSWSYVQSQVMRLPFTKAASNIQDVANATKAGVSPKDEAKKEEEDITHILDQLNLSAVNNRAFSFSKESQKLVEEFTQILKDIVNGVPTAYDDLESLLTNRDKQLREMFDKMPPFMQNMVKGLPAKLTGTLAPGLLAAASEKPGADGQRLAATSQPRRKKQKVGLKQLVQGDAVVTMLRGILDFLKLRFPAVISGTNVLLSLAVFLLLFVFWYCHKRGKETRLEKERLAAEDGRSDLGSSSELEDSLIVEDDPKTRAESSVMGGSKHKETNPVG